MNSARSMFVWLCLLASTSAVAAAFRDGDIIFHTSRSAQSAAIQRATHSPYSHVGVIFVRDGRPYVFEASATVRYTPLAQWAARGSDGKYVVKRLKAGLTTVQAAKLRAGAQEFAGKPYDQYFEWSNERIYCSELVWKIYAQATGIELGQLQKLGEFDLQDPVVKTKLRERYGSHVPLDEPVISPAALYDSPFLTTLKQP